MQFCFVLTSCKFTNFTLIDSFLRLVLKFYCTLIQPNPFFQHLIRLFASTIQPFVCYCNIHQAGGGWPGTNDDVMKALGSLEEALTKAEMKEHKVNFNTSSVPPSHCLSLTASPCLYLTILLSLSLALAIFFFPSHCPLSFPFCLVVGRYPWPLSRRNTGIICFLQT